MHPTVFIPTNTVDGTTDLLIKIANDKGIDVFRWNIDLWSHYDIEFDGNHFRLADPVGREITLGADNVIMLWRKPFTDLMSFDGLALGKDDQEVAMVQVAQWLKALVVFMRAEKSVRLIEPYADQRLPKLFQLTVAKDFFFVPPSQFSINATDNSSLSEVITKPLGDPSVGNEHIFFTKRVNQEDLYRPFPWFIQQALVEGVDVTCVFINGKSHFFVCDFSRGVDSIDWRTEINTKNQSKWHPLLHFKVDEWSESVNKFMNRVNLYYGRLDFILIDDKLCFLECNSNGQFGWLDEHSDHPLHENFLMSALDSCTAV